MPPQVTNRSREKTDWSVSEISRMSKNASPKRDLARYSRQVLCAQVGEEGQRQLGHAQLVLIGCGALGSMLANLLVRAGIGALRIIDRDFIELNNLQRQMLFDERDINENLPKAEAAARTLRRINSAVEIDAVVDDVNPDNIERHCENVELILDGTDNLETRYLINDVAVKHDVPWVYGACISETGLVMAVVPGQTPCLRCVWNEPPPPGSVETCDMVGVLGTAAAVVASFQATEAMKILMGRTADLMGLTSIDVWTGRTRTLDVHAAHEAGQCPCCGRHRFEFLEGDRLPAIATLCGRDAVQVVPSEPAELDLKRLALRLPGHTHARHSLYMLKFRVDALDITLFQDGRAIVQGTTDPTVARSVVAKYVGV